MLLCTITVAPLHLAMGSSPLSIFGVGKGSRLSEQEARV